MNKNKWLRLQDGEDVEVVCGRGTSPYPWVSYNRDHSMWGKSTRDKFRSISPDCKTAKKILEQFYDEEWLSYKAYNPQFAQWEYLVLAKLVSVGKLKVMTYGNGKLCPRLRFKNPNRHAGVHLDETVLK